MFDGGEIPVFAASFTVVAVFLLLRRFKQNGIKDVGKQYPPSLSVLALWSAILRRGLTVLPEHFKKSAEKHGPIFSFTTGKRMVVVLNSYDAIYDAMVRHSEAFADRNALFTEEKVINPELRGIIHSRYNHSYKKYHKLSLSILKEFGYGVQGVSETRILQEVESMHGEILKQNGRPINPKWLITFATSNVVLSILFGKDFQQSLPKNHSTIIESSAECVENMDMTLNMAPFVRFLPMFGKRIDLLRTSCERLLNGLEEGIKFNKSNSSEATFVGRFLEIEGTDYDHQDLLYVLRDLVFASTDTVSTTMQWAVVELANHPEIQNRFQREIDEMVPGDRLPSLDDKPRLPYTEAVILEIMRRRTVVPLLVPHATLKDTKVLEYDVPKDCMVIPNAHSAHMDPQLWKDPDTFRPERFLDADNKVINSQKMIGFGLGKRSCLGEVLARQKVFLFLTSLVQRFDICPPEGQDSIAVKEIIASTTAPSHFEVRLIPRMKATQCQG